jgi:hypothetical protein
MKVQTTLTVTLVAQPDVHGHAGRSYAVQGNAALTTAGWTNVVALPAPAVTQPAEWTDTNATSQQFYRLATPAPNP